MKRFIPVLALVLILIMTAWEEADSRRGPQLEIAEVHYDHPWGGDQNSVPPTNFSTSVSSKDQLSFEGIIKNFEFRFLFNGSTFMFSGFREFTRNNTNTETNTTVTESNDNNNTTQSSGGRGM